MKRKLFSLLLVAALLAGLAVPAMAKDNPAGERIDCNTEEIDTNYGSIFDNGVFNAGVNNEWVVKDNQGTIAFNNSEVDTNSEAGTVTRNDGTVGTNEGTVKNNTPNGKITANYGNVELNAGTVEKNMEEGTVKMKGAATKVSEDGKSVSVGGGTVLENYGTVVVTDFNNNETKIYAVVAEDTAVKDADGKTIGYDAFMQAVNGEFKMPTLEDAQEAAKKYLPEGAVLTGMKDRDSDTMYEFDKECTTDKVLYLVAVYNPATGAVEYVEVPEYAVPAYVLEEFQAESGAAVLKMNTVLYSDAEMAKKEIKVQVDDVEVSTEDYELTLDKDFNIVVTFTDAFLSKLPAGEHNLTLHFANGNVYRITLNK